jgi:hypothetical protein
VEKLLYTCQQLLVDYNQLETYIENHFMRKIELPSLSLLRLSFLDATALQRVPNVPSDFLSIKHRFFDPQSIG